jgi:class 3 adenylate cyclase/tetratricopeptide (TPR) repeat protein
MVTCANCGTQNPAEARFCLGCGTALEQAPAPPTEARKTVTLVFSDVTGSTALGEALDPETTRAVMSRYFDEMRRVIERHGGTVEKFVGDAVMAVFGIPELHEDDAVRAVRAAAEMRERLTELNATQAGGLQVVLEVRTGVNTGEVVAGDASRGEAFATGDAVNVTARLEQAAEPGEILIGRETYGLVRDAVTAEPVEPLALKGKAEPVEAWQLLAVSPQAPGVARRLDSRLVGREGELRLLRETLEEVEEKRSCRLLTVLGSPGAGKSRLANELIRSVGKRATVIQGPCLPYGEGITFWPVAEMVRGAAEIDEGDSPEGAVAKIAALLPRDDESVLAVQRVASLVGIEGEGAQLQELFWAIRRLFEALARERPLVAIFDDIHWAEPSLLDLIEYVTGWSSGAPILLLCLARQDLLELRPSLAAPKPNASSILLEPLDRSESEELIENLLGRAGLEEDVRLRIAEAAEGNPLFVEELLQMLIDDGILARRNGDWVAAGDMEALAIPPSIQALLAARLDRLEEGERATLQRASVIGRIFWWGAVSELSPAAEQSKVAGYLQTLVRKELISSDPGTFAGEDAFRFGHILVRDAAYRGLPKAARAELHEVFAGWLERQAGERMAEYEEILGYHLEQSYRCRAELGFLDERAAAVALRAAKRLVSAGERALGRGDVPSAANLLERGVALLPDDDPNRTRVLLDLAEARQATGDLRKAAADLERAAEAARDPVSEQLALIGRLYFRTLVDPDADLDELMKASEHARAVFEQAGDERGQSRAWRAIAEVHLTTCQWATSAAAVEQALVHAERADLRREIVPILSHLANAYFWGSTPVDEGIERCREIAERARGLRIVEANVFCYLGGFEAMKGNFDGARALVARGRGIFEDLGHRYGLASHSVVAGPVELLAGDPAAAVLVLRRGYESLEEMGETGVMSSIAAMLGEALYEQGEREEAERVVAAAEQMATPDDAAAQVAVRTTRARLLAARSERGEAEALAHEAVRRALETDFLDLQGNAFMALAEALERPSDVESALRGALDAFDRKGHAVSAARAARALDQLRGD